VVQYPTRTLLRLLMSVFSRQITIIVQAIKVLGFGEYVSNAHNWK
jgi:hypothetical protein